MRRQFVTHPKFQTSFTLSFVYGLLLIFFFIGGAAIVSLFWLSGDPLLEETQRVVLLASAKEFGTYLGFLLLLSLLVFGWIGFYLSYKFVGPLFRLESWLNNQIETKNPDPIILRPGDELEPISVVLNRLVHRKFGKDNS